MTTDESPGWKANPEYIIDFDPVPARVTGRIGDTIVVDSTRARVALEQGHAPLYYVPKEDVRLDLMQPIEHESYCPYKGVASYWSLHLPERTIDRFVWSYRKPFRQMQVMADHIGFFWHLIDEWQEDGVTVTAPRDILGRCGVDGHLRALYPELAKEWHPEKNLHIWPYEIAPFNAISVWWKDGSGREWQESVRARVLAHAGGRQAASSPQEQSESCGCGV